MRHTNVKLITDFHKGVYFGEIVEERDGGRTLVLKNMRHVFHYALAPNGNRGVYGLATYGPVNGSKIGPSVRCVLYDVAKVVDCSDEAIERLEAIKW